MTAKGGWYLGSTAKFFVSLVDMKTDSKVGRLESPLSASSQCSPNFSTSSYSQIKLRSLPSMENRFFRSQRRGIPIPALHHDCGRCVRLQVIPAALCTEPRVRFNWSIGTWKLCRDYDDEHWLQTMHHSSTMRVDPPVPTSNPLIDQVIVIMSLIACHICRELSGSQYTINDAWHTRYSLNRNDFFIEARRPVFHGRTQDRLRRPLNVP